jgi:hypothetical protein
MNRILLASFWMAGTMLCSSAVGSTLSCGSSSLPYLVARSAGSAQVGDIVLTCSASADVNGNASFQLQLNADFTSSSNPYLEFENPYTGDPVSSPYDATTYSGSLATFPDIPLLANSGDLMAIRFSNLYVDPKTVPLVYPIAPVTGDVSGKGDMFDPSGNAVDFGTQTVGFALTPAPEPASIWLLSAGILALGARRFARR